MSAIILLTFLGTGNYQPCAYAIGDAVTGKETFFSAALAARLRPWKVISLQTEKAAEKHGLALEEAVLALDVAHESVRIPEGHSESELWGIFTALTTHVPEDCTLHLDITHGFRSLPLLGFIALSYLRTTRNITIGGIHYGAWEARTGDTAPTFDLTPFLTLLDWTAAANQFLDTGSATRLGALLSQTQQNLWLQPGTLAKGDLPKALKNLSSALREASLNQSLLRTGHLAISAAKVTEALEAARHETARHASPFLEVLTPVRDALTRANGTDLPTLRDLTGWLASRGQTAAALTLASEWLVSWVMLQLGEPDHHTTEKHRRPYADCLNLLIDQAGENKIKEPTQASLAHLSILRQTVPPTLLQQLAMAGSQIKTARNDLNHAGFNRNPKTGDSIVALAKSISASLDNFPV